MKKPFLTDLRNSTLVASLVEELVPDFIKEFSIYLMTERNLKQATAWMACMQLKGVIIRAHNNGLIPRNPFAQTE